MHMFALARQLHTSTHAYLAYVCVCAYKTLRRETLCLLICISRAAAYVCGCVIIAMRPYVCTFVIAFHFLPFSIFQFFAFTLYSNRLNLRTNIVSAQAAHFKMEYAKFLSSAFMCVCICVCVYDHIPGQAFI